VLPFVCNEGQLVYIKLVYDAVLAMRIKYRWQALDQEMIEMNYAKACGESYKSAIFSNGSNNYWHAVDIFYSRSLLARLSHNKNVLIFFFELQSDLKKTYHFID
jgi:hypothetical protein